MCAGCSWGSQGPAKVLTGAVHFGSGQKAMSEHEVGLQGGGNEGTNWSYEDLAWRRN